MISKKVEAIFKESQVMALIEEFNSHVTLIGEGIATLDKKIDDVKSELKEDIAVLDYKIMGLSKRVDDVETRLSREIAEVKSDLNAHRNNTELHSSVPYGSDLSSASKSIHSSPLEG